MEANRTNTTEEVIARVRTRDDIRPHARIVGAWVWVEFPDKPSDDTRDFLKTEGFRWNPKRSAWQHSCGVFRRFHPSADPRFLYGSVKLEEVRA